MGIRAKPQKLNVFCHLKTYLDIGGFIIDLRVGKFSHLLAEMMLEYMGYTITQPKTEH